MRVTNSKNEKNLPENLLFWDCNGIQWSCIVKTLIDEFRIFTASTPWMSTYLNLEGRYTWNWLFSRSNRRKRLHNCPPNWARQLNFRICYTTFHFLSIYLKTNNFWNFSSSETPSPNLVITDFWPKVIHSLKYQIRFMWLILVILVCIELNKWF